MNTIARKRLVCLRLLVLAACLLFFPRPSPAETPPNPQKPTDEETLKRILGNWRARQDRTKSFNFEWTTRLVPKSARRIPIQTFRRALWVSGSDRIRFERERVGEAKNWDHRVRDQRACDGSTTFILEWLRGPSDAPQGAVLSRNGTSDFEDFECEAIFRALRPLDAPSGWQNAKFRVVTQSAIFEGLHCVKLQRTLGRETESCWLDPNREDLVVFCERSLRGPGWSVAIKYRGSPRSGWIPEQWTFRNPSSAADLQCEVTTAAVNEPIPAHVFRIDFPPGALVFDLSARKQYVIAGNGSRTPAPPFDAVSSPAFQRALDVVEPFTFEPEPFRCAVEFLSLHDKIPVESDIPAFRKAGIDLEKPECHCDIQGLTLREQLRWLSAQFPKPIRLVEKDGKLVLTPASNSKPVK
jgi:hypothetical protein